jgi:hypothetical protein
MIEKDDTLDQLRGFWSQKLDRENPKKVKTERTCLDEYRGCVFFEPSFVNVPYDLANGGE